MFTVEDAYDLAREAHEGMTYNGHTYFEGHLLPVAELLRPLGEEFEIVGILHDAVEDTDWVTFELLREKGASEDVIAGIDSMTRRDDETYAELIGRAAADRIGRHGKVVDNYVNVISNSALAATDSKRAASLLRRYRKASETLRAAIVAAGEAAVVPDPFA